MSVARLISIVAYLSSYWQCLFGSPRDSLPEKDGRRLQQVEVRLGWKAMDLGLRHRKECESREKPPTAESHQQNSALKSHHICRARLKRSATMSAILCAFSLQSMAELQVKVPTQCPVWIFTMFAVCTTTLVAIHILSLVISNFILPSIDYMGGDDETRLRMLHEYPNNSDVRRFVEIAWTFTTLLGLFLFLVEIVLLCWVKFYDHSRLACWAGTAVMAPFIVAYVAICTYFHRELSRGVYAVAADGTQDLACSKRGLRSSGIPMSVSEVD